MRFNREILRRLIIDGKEKRPKDEPWNSPALGGLERKSPSSPISRGRGPRAGDRSGAVRRESWPLHLGKDRILIT